MRRLPLTFRVLLTRDPEFRSFRTSDGREIVFRNPAGYRPGRYVVGQRVTVLYDPSKPSDAQIKSFFT